MLTIEGDYTLFAHLETVYLGVLARRTLISTNVRRVVRAAYLGEKLGDISALENPASLDQIKRRAS